VSSVKVGYAVAFFVRRKPPNDDHPTQTTNKLQFWQTLSVINTVERRRKSWNGSRQSTTPPSRATTSGGDNPELANGCWNPQSFDPGWKLTSRHCSVRAFLERGRRLLRPSLSTISKPTTQSPALHTCIVMSDDKANRHPKVCSGIF
jgi:hypothetical protein